MLVVGLAGSPGVTQSPGLGEELDAAGLGQGALRVGQAQQSPSGPGDRTAGASTAQGHSDMWDCLTELVTPHTCKYSSSVPCFAWHVGRGGSTQLSGLFCFCFQFQLEKIGANFQFAAEQSAQRASGGAGGALVALGSLGTALGLWAAPVPEGFPCPPNWPGCPAPEPVPALTLCSQLLSKGESSLGDKGVSLH